MAEKRRLRIGSLSTVTMVGCEIARLYKQCRRGEIESVEAYRLSNVLSMLAKCLEQSALEQRLEQLEKALAEPSNVTAFRRTG
jgi:hypothetical protein